MDMASVPSFKAFARITDGKIQVQKYSRIIRSTNTDLFSHLVFLPCMHQTVKRCCPGCGQYFLPGGYANHLRHIRDPRCQSVQTAVFQQAFDAPSQLLDDSPTPGPSFSPSPIIPGPPHAPEIIDLDVEMSDIENLDQDHTLMDRNITPPPPSIGADGHGADDQDILDESFGALPCHRSSAALVIGSDADTDTDSDSGSDIDSDLSDAGSRGSNQSHFQEPTTPPSKLF